MWKRPFLGHSIITPTLDSDASVILMFVFWIPSVSSKLAIQNSINLRDAVYEWSLIEILHCCTIYFRVVIHHNAVVFRIMILTHQITSNILIELQLRQVRVIEVRPHHHNIENQVRLTPIFCSFYRLVLIEYPLSFFSNFNCLTAPFFLVLTC